MSLNFYNNVISREIFTLSKMKILENISLKLQSMFFSYPIEDRKSYDEFDE